jgi:hypothetical protein
MDYYILIIIVMIATAIIAFLNISSFISNFFLLRKIFIRAIKIQKVYKENLELFKENLELFKKLKCKSEFVEKQADDLFKLMEIYNNLLCKNDVSKT